MARRAFPAFLLIFLPDFPQHVDVLVMQRLEGTAAYPKVQPHFAKQRFFAGHDAYADQRRDDVVGLALLLPGVLHAVFQVQLVNTDELFRHHVVGTADAAGGACGEGGEEHFIKAVEEQLAGEAAGKALQQEKVAGGMLDAHEAVVGEEQGKLLLGQVHLGVQGNIVHHHGNAAGVCNIGVVAADLVKGKAVVEGRYGADGVRAGLCRMHGQILRRQGIH